VHCGQRNVLICCDIISKSPYSIASDLACAGVESLCALGQYTAAASTKHELSLDVGGRNLHHMIALFLCVRFLRTMSAVLLSSNVMCSSRN
jgi:hypothetical protein